MVTRDDALQYLARFEAIEEADRAERSRGAPDIEGAFRVALSLIAFAGRLPVGEGSAALREASDASVREIWARLRERLA